MPEKKMNELAQFIDDFLYHNRYNKADIARQLGISRQGLYNMMHKDNFGIADANRILTPLGFRIDFDVKPLKNPIYFTDAVDKEQ